MVSNLYLKLSEFQILKGDDRPFGNLYGTASSTVLTEFLSPQEIIDMPEDELYREANKWELSHGGLSGRTASQFITHLLGRQRMD